LRDKVGNTPTALAPDGALDGTFRVTVNGGIWPRPVTPLHPRRVPSGGIWDTDPATSYWALGATANLDGALLNAANGTVSFGVADGGSFYVFASDLNPTPFRGGAVFTLSANFADGTSATTTVTLPAVPTITSVSPNAGSAGTSLTVSVTGSNFQPGASASFGGGITVNSTTVLASTQLSVAIAIDSAAAIGVRDVKVTNPDGLVVTSAAGFTVNPPAPTLSLSFLGKLRDKVGPNATAFWPDTALDGTFRVTVQGGSGPRTVTRIELRQTSGGGIWDTDPATAYWARRAP